MFWPFLAVAASTQKWLIYVRLETFTDFDVQIYWVFFPLLYSLRTTYIFWMQELSPNLSSRTLDRLNFHMLNGSGGVFANAEPEFGNYRSGPDLVRIANELGFSDQYSNNFPSRSEYAFDLLKRCNGTSKITKLLCYVFDPLEFSDIEKCKNAAKDMNRFMLREGYKIVIKEQSGAALRSATSENVGFGAAGVITTAGIEENLNKVKQKLRDGDLRGAITNARSLCEDVLFEIERELSSAPPANYDGDLPRLYKRVGKLLNADPDQYREGEPAKRLIRGMVSVVDGLSGISNAMGDRHGGNSQQPKHHHAVLCVDAAHTLCTFLISSYETKRTASAVK